MLKNYSRFLSILPAFLLSYQLAQAKVEKPNYDFSLTSLEVFFPGNKINVAQAKWNDFTILQKKGNLTHYRFNISHIRYKFPVHVQVDNDGKITDFIARLPSYFLHDVFHQSMINRYGKQSTYKKVEEQAVYQWERKDMILTYAGACTITCFPIYLTAEGKDTKVSTLLSDFFASEGR